MEHGSDQWSFDGFSNPNFTAVPDEFFDQLVTRLGSAEIRVLLYIIRRTFGFKKARDSISLSQMVEGIVKKNGTRLDSGTGLKKAAVCRALASLEKRGIIIRTKRFDYSGGAIATSYQLHMSGQEKVANSDTPVYGERQGLSMDQTRPCLRRETHNIQLTIDR
jgi:DNA-binding MarR family transcriptional regulator